MLSHVIVVKLLGKVEYNHKRRGSGYKVTDIETGKSLVDLYYRIALKDNKEEVAWNMGKYVVSLGGDAFTVVSAFEKLLKKVYYQF